MHAKLTSIVIAILAFTAAALANPREAVTFTNITSDGLQGGAANQITYAFFTGDYAATKVRVSGTLISNNVNSYAHEARILVIPPGDTQPFVVQPFTQGPFSSISTPAGGVSFDLPVPHSYSVAGRWAFRFFESYDDTYPDGTPTYDAVWYHITFTLDDGTANPAGTISGWGHAEPAAAGLNTTVLKVAAAPGTAPASTGVSVTANLTSIAGGGAQSGTMYDDGPAGGHGDEVAGDNVFSTTVSVPGIWPGGIYNLPFTVADAQGRTYHDTLPLNVQGVTDLGTLADSPSPLTLASADPSGAHWFKFTIPTVAQSTNRFLDLYADSGLDATVALYKSNGDLLVSDDHLYWYSYRLGELSFGLALPSRYGVNTPFTGQNGSLLAGTYYVCLLRGIPQNVGPSHFATTTGWPSYEAASLTIHMEQQHAPAITGNTTTANGSALVTANVTPGGYPTNFQYTVSGNFTSLGAGVLQFYDDGTHGDVTAGDHLYSLSYPLPASVAPGTYAIPLTVTDEFLRGGQGVATVHVDEAGDVIATAKPIDGPIAITTLSGALTPNDADMFRIHICDPANFSARVTSGTLVDSQLFLFRSDGRGVATDDDSTTGAAALAGPLVTAIPVGDYYLAISGYDKDPVDSTGQALWLDDPYDRAHAPDGPAATHPIAAWDSNNSGTGTYIITLTGVSGSPCPAQPHCGSADFNCDGDLGTDSDISAFFACLAGSCPPPPCTSSADFNGDGDLGTDADIEAFFRVLAGGGC